MSTRAIETLIEKMEERAFRETLGTAMASAARAELEAIRKAVAFAVRETSITDRENEHVDLLRAIAKEAP